MRKMDFIWIYFGTLILAVLFEGIVCALPDHASNQLPTWSASNNLNSKTAQSHLGSPFKSLTASLSPDSSNGPILLQDTNFIEIMAHFDRERIPERVVHAHGYGAFGVFKPSTDISKYTKASIFRPGTSTDIFIRFSTVVGEVGTADTVSDTRGFAIKFYTEDGIWDLVGNNLPVFAIRDPILFPMLIHSRKRNPATNLPDANSFWDFVSLRPETIHHTLRQFSDLGTPASFRHMNGFGVHAFKFVNAANEIHFVKFHHLTSQGVRNMYYNESTTLAGTDPNYLSRDLYNAIASGNFPSWKMYIQIMTLNQSKEFSGAFDATKIWPEDKFPLKLIGEFTLNRVVDNFFSQVQQAAFDPGNLIPGIEQSPDRLLQGRSFSYADTQRYRLGTTNFINIPVNRPKNGKHGGKGGDTYNYLRDGIFATDTSDGPNYFPNSFNGPSQCDSAAPTCGEAPVPINGENALRIDSGPIGDNFSQVATFYNSLNPAEKGRLVENIVRDLKNAHESVQDRVLANVFSKIDADLFRRIRLGLYIESAIVV